MLQSEAGEALGSIWQASGAKPRFLNDVPGVFVSFPIASATVAGVTGREGTDVRSSVAFDVFPADLCQ